MCVCVHTCACVCRQVCMCVLAGCVHRRGSSHSLWCIIENTMGAGPAIPHQALFRWKLARRIPVSEFTAGNASSAPALSAFLLFKTQGLKGVYSQE